jgi:hypothetical protein
MSRDVLPKTQALGLIKLKILIVKTNDIIQIITQFPQWIQIILLSLLMITVIVVSVLRIKALRDAIVYWIEKRIYKIKTSDLKSHKIFKEKPLLKHRVNAIRFEDKYKEDILRLFYNTKLNVDFSNLEQFIQNNNFDKDFDVLSKSMDLFNKMQDDFDEQILKIINQYCSTKIKDSQSVAKCAEEIYDFVMNSKGGFSEHRINRLDDLYEAVELVNSSPLYDNNHEKIYQLLDVLHANISKAVMQVGKIFMYFNGQIKIIIENYKEKFVA